MQKGRRGSQHIHPVEPIMFSRQVRYSVREEWQKRSEEYPSQTKDHSRSPMPANRRRTMRERARNGGELATAAGLVRRDV